ncbi:MAG TPA: L-tyrosine/L-tryptophan isonitrile synthase family protein, partial [Kineosporiaceae bacterium]
ERVHPPGVRVLVCSDGHVFADLIGVTDEDVDAYVDALRGMIRAEGLFRIGTFDLRDVFVLHHPDGRVELMPHHQARARGELVEVDGRPDHYRADPLAG